MMRLTSSIDAFSGVRTALFWAVLLGVVACSSGRQPSDLSTLYDRAAQYHGVERDPIILIPGLLGSKLTHVPASPPSRLDLALIAGDSTPTLARMAVDRMTGSLSELDTAPGDGRVLRSSALMDERVGGTWAPTLRSPLEWSQVVFLFEDHVEMTADPMFTDNLLYYLLVEPS